MKTLTLITVLLINALFSTSAMPLSYSKKQIEYNNLVLINKMIEKIKPNLNTEKRNKIANHLYLSSKRFNIDPKIMIAIIDTESDFVNEKVSTTGDLSLAQINTKVWNKEFKRLNKELIDSKRLKTDEAYALKKMAEILSILKTRHGNKDQNWFARYHSHTKKYKNQYSAKVSNRMRVIASVAMN